MLLGSGSEITGGLGAVTLMRHGPPNTLYNGSSATAIELPGTTASWSLTASAICADS